MIARRIVVRGAVQGVGYRYSMIESADALGVSGWVRNCRDGSVDAFAQGTEVAVGRLLEWARHGPPAARVSDLQVVEEKIDTALAGFGIR